MARIYPARIQDRLLLSRLLARLLDTLEACPLQVSLKTLSYDTQIPECIFKRLLALPEHPDDRAHITAEDYHILFANILFRYPTVRIHGTPDGEIWFEM